MGMVKHSQSCQNSIFAISLQYLKKEVRYEVDCLHADKHKVSYKLILITSLGGGESEKLKKGGGDLSSLQNVFVGNLAWFSVPVWGHHGWPQGEYL